jgi:2-polyprenyl-3-methyl-5-hydroxy-6-metoxy-1,4-benzoquinol methylase
MKKMIKSPLYQQGQAKFIGEISVKTIIKEYLPYGINPSYLLNEIKSVSIYECLNTTYKFYYPFNISGDSKFYEHFQNFDWYYMPWKWEHEVTKEYLKDGQSILEVGCAHGAFLKKINELYDLKESVGLELNESTLADSSKWKIVNQFVQEYQKENKEKFDIVCSYQVLEHIADVHSFIQAKIECLKIGGTLIISVPNNESYIKDLDSALNMPPHHMGLWDTKSLHSLENIFPIQLIKFHYEKIQDYHVGSYLFAKHYSKYQRTLGKIIRKLHKVSGKYISLEKKVLDNKKTIIGQTILVSFKKV